VPLRRGGHSIGIMLVTRREPGSLTDETISMLKRMGANICFALDNFAHEAARKEAERAMRRLNVMFGAISATNEAILRARNENELYQFVCDAAVHKGKSITTVVLLAEPGSIWLNPVAGTGESLEKIASAKFSIDPDNLYGNGISGRAFRSQKPHVKADVFDTEQGRGLQLPLRGALAVGGVAVPLIKAGKSVGVLLFFVGQSWAADDEIVAVMARMAENVSFALDNFERAAEKARADEQKERLSRMFAALSATNEAIMRAKSRAELFQLVCESVSSGGKFTSTTIALARPDTDFLDMVAVAGPTAQNTRRVRLSTNAETSRRPRSLRHRVPHAPGLHQQRLSERYTRHRLPSRGPAPTVPSRGAAFPLHVKGEVVGIVLFLSAETGHLHGRVRRAPAAAHRQCLLRTGEFRSRRREEQGRRAHRISRLP